jgi:outer membrane receptor protein involved in Fe transport
MQIGQGLRRAALATVAAAPLLIGADAAFAQARASAPSVSEVVVTAEKREENLREVPQSISVVGAAELERQQAFNVQQYAALVPGLTVTQSEPGRARVTLRGVNTGSVASTLGVYVDETPYGSSTGLVNAAVLTGDFDTFDVERIEVLRGPQGTLYGASSLGGVLKFVTRAPQLGQFSARVRGGVSSVEGGDQGWNGSAVANVPLGDKAAVRVSAFKRKLPGYIDEVGTAGSMVGSNVNESEIEGGRASLLFQPVESFSVRATAILQDAKNGEPSTFDADPRSTAPLYGGLTHTAFTPTTSQFKYKLYNLTADWDLGFATLTSATSYGKLDQTSHEDVTSVSVGGGLTFGSLFTALFSTPGVPLGGNEPVRIYQRKTTQEFRLVSPSNDHLEWLLGAFYTKETGGIHQTFDAIRISDQQPITGLPLLGQADVDSKYEELAGFGNLTWHLTPRFELQLGGRYSQNKQRAEESLNGILVGGASQFTPVNSKESVFTYSVAPRYSLSDTASVYLRVAKGYRPGGPNLLPPGAPAGTPTSYDADTLVSFEGGLKADFFDRMVSLDAAVFYLDWDNIQLFTRINNVGLNANGGKAVSKGLEFTATARPTAGLTLVASGALTDAELTKDTPPTVGGLKGERLPFVPRYNLTLSGSYDWTAWSDVDAFVGGTLALVGGRDGGFDNAYRAAIGNRLHLDSYAQLDLQAGLRRGNLSAEVFVQNLANERGVVNTGAYGNLPNNALPVTSIRPRTIGLTLSADF